LSWLPHRSDLGSLKRQGDFYSAANFATLIVADRIEVILRRSARGAMKEAGSDMLERA
jgi:hypothetical protein